VRKRARARGCRWGAGASVAAARPMRLELSISAEYVLGPPDQSGKSGGRHQPAAGVLGERRRYTGSSQCLLTDIRGSALMPRAH